MTVGPLLWSANAGSAIETRGGLFICRAIADREVIASSLLASWVLSTSACSGS